MRSTLALLALVAGCYQTATTSTLDVIPPQQSGALWNEPPIEAARAVASVLEAHGYVLQDQGKAAAGVQLKMTRAVVAVVPDARSWDTVGSVMYATVLPVSGGSTVTFVGKPTLDGEENAEVPFNVKDAYMTGAFEAEVIHGALAELELKGVVAGALPASTPMYVEPAKAPDAACMAQRKQILAQADATKDLDQRAKLVLSAPECPAVLQPIGS
jgi:hypothetical protein